MNRLKRILSQALLVTVLGLPLTTVCGTSPAAPNKAPNFHLLDHTGRSFELHRQTRHRAVVLFVAGNGCPIVRQSIPELKRLRGLYSDRGVAFLLLNANTHDTPAEIITEAREFAMDFPILLDPSQAVARALGIQRTGEAIVIGTKDWQIAYRGAVDDRLTYGHQKPAAHHHYLSDALTSLLDGRTPAVSRTEVKGCAVAYAGAFARNAATPDYVRDVAPLLNSHCTECHRRGAVAPFAFSSYERVRGHSETIREVLLEDRMPPWHAAPGATPLANDRSLAPEAKRTLLAWIEAGSPRGTGPDPLPTIPTSSAPDWPLGTPDLVVSLPEEAKIPASGLVPYQMFTVRAPVTEDVWVRGAVIRAGNPKVVHHCLVFIKYPEALRHLEPKQDEGSAGFFAGYVPGTEPVFFPAGTGKRIPKGAELIFQMHYTTTGREETDRTELGLYLAQEPPARELVTGAANAIEIEIPPGARAHPVQASFVFKTDSLIHEFSPHMHLRGASFSYTARYPDGREELLLNVPRYDFNWQTLYRLRTPHRIPAGTTLLCRGTFDNSSDNPANPDPKATVRFGEQTNDEMFIGYFNYSAAEKGSGPRPAPGPKDLRAAAAGPVEVGNK